MAAWLTSRRPDVNCCENVGQPDGTVRHGSDRVAFHSTQTHMRIICQQQQQQQGAACGDDGADDDDDGKSIDYCRLPIFLLPHALRNEKFTILYYCKVRIYFDLLI